MRRFLTIALPLIGVVIFVVIIRRTGLDNILDVFRSARPARLALLPVLLALIVLLRGVRWHYLMGVIGVRYGLWRSCVVWMIGFFAAAVTPAKVGDALRAFYVSDETGRSFAESFVTVFVDRMWDLALVLVLGIISILVFSRVYIEIPSVWLVVAGSAAILLLAYLVLNRSLVRAILKPLAAALVPGKYEEMLSKNFHAFYDSLGIYGRSHVVSLVTFLLTAVYWALVFFLGYYAAYILTIDVPIGYVFLIMPIITLVELIPISVSGLGTREAAVIYFFSVVGIESAHAVGFSIAYLLCGTYLTSLAGLLFWMRHPVKLGR